MERSVFFNSAPGDPRTYQASDFAGYFGTVLSSGLFHTDNIPALQVHCDGSDMRTYVDAGKAAIQGYFYENTSDLYLQHALPEATLDRIDRIVLRLDKRNQSRFIRLFVVQGLSAAAPVPPALQRDEYIYELCLAEIRVKANTSTLIPANLVDKRLDQALCGLVYSLISIPTSQFQQEWDTFMASVQDDYTTSVPYAVATGTANAYAISTPIASLVAGLAVSVKINVASTGPSTLDWDGKGAKGLKKADGSNITNLKAGGVYTFRYDGANFIVQGEGGEYGTAVASEVLATKTIGTDTGLVTGTMPNNGAKTYTPGTANIPIDNGYHNGSVVVGDPDLKAANVRSGVNIFGVVGSSVVVDTSSANLDPAFLLSPYSGYDDGVKKVGTMVDNGAWTVTPSVGYIVIPQGYHNGSGVVNGDPDLIAANIFVGRNIFGVAGSLKEGWRSPATNTEPQTLYNYYSKNGQYGSGSFYSASDKLLKKAGGDNTIKFYDVNGTVVYNIASPDTTGRVVETSEQGFTIIGNPTYPGTKVYFWNGVQNGSGFPSLSAPANVAAAYNYSANWVITTTGIINWDGTVLWAASNYGSVTTGYAWLDGTVALACSTTHLYVLWKGAGGANQGWTATAVSTATGTTIAALLGIIKSAVKTTW